MTFKLEELITIYPDELYLDVSPQQREEAWSQTRNYSNQAACWNAYLNLLVLKVFVAYLQEEPDLLRDAETRGCGDVEKERFPALVVRESLWESDVKEQPLSIELNDLDPGLSSIWEFLNGTAIKLGKTRLVIIPEEVTVSNELSVPQEWIDIADWAADYYLGMAVNLEDGWLRIYGYATHRKLKEQGKYEPMGRTYALGEDDLIEDINVMWVARELCAAERAEIAPLPQLSLAQAEKLIAQLGQPSAYSPRLNTAFAQWAMLLVNEQWRQKLYRMRSLSAATLSVTTTLSKALVRLSQWLEQDFGDALNAGWQQIIQEPLAATSLSVVRSSVHSQDDYLRLQAATQLGQVNPKDSDAINTLLELLATSQEQWICQKAAECLGSIAPHHPQAAVSMQKQIKINDHPVALIAALRPLYEEMFAVRLEVRSVDNQTYLPLGLKLVVSSGSDSIELPAEELDSYLELLLPEVRQGDQFSVQVAWHDTQVTEDFIV